MVTSTKFQDAYIDRPSLDDLMKSNQLIISPAWDTPVEKIDFDQIERLYGRLAKDFAEIAKFIRLAVRQSQFPTVRSKIWAVHSICDREEEAGTFGFFTSKNIKTIMRIHYSLLKLKPLIEFYIGSKEAAKDFFDRSRGALSLSCRNVSSESPETSEILNKVFGSKRYGNGETVAKLCEQWHQLAQISICGKAGDEKKDTAIDDKELTILMELADGADKTCSQVEIDAATGIKRGTLKDKLPRLERIGLIHRPLGKRSGYKITDKGREIAKRNE